MFVGKATGANTRGEHLKGASFR